MIFDLSDKIDKQRAEARFSALCEAGKVIDLKEKKKLRTIDQNTYIHVVFKLFGVYFGYTEKEAKDLLKRMAGKTYEKKGRTFPKSTADMDTKELSDFIDWIRNQASIQGQYIASSEEYIQDQVRLDKEIENHKQYL